MSENLSIEEIVPEKFYKMVWKSTSDRPGYIESTIYTEAQLPVHNRDQVLGPDREFVEILPGTNFWTILFDQDNIDKDHELWDYRISHWDWDLNEVVIETYPPLTWDDIRLRRNTMLSVTDNQFNIDTPEPLKTQWIEHRQLLRDLPDRELAANRTPDTVFWNDYLPPYPESARAGLSDEEAAKCVWYVPVTVPKK